MRHQGLVHQRLEYLLDRATRIPDIQGIVVFAMEDRRIHRKSVGQQSKDRRGKRSCEKQCTIRTTKPSASLAVVYVLDSDLMPGLMGIPSVD